jgi:hypothetical protein
MTGTADASPPILIDSPPVGFAAPSPTYRPVAAVHKRGNARDRIRVREKRRVALVGHFKRLECRSPCAHGLHGRSRQEV